MAEPRNEFTNVASLRAEAIGEPGERTFRLLVDSESSSASVWLEKEQLFQLALGIQQLLAGTSEEDAAELRELIEQHREYTGSAQAERVLDAWPDVLSQFVKVMPIDYKRVLAERKKHDEEMEAAIHDDLTGEYSVMSG